MADLSVYAAVNTLSCGFAMAGGISGLPGAIPIKYLRTGRKHRYGHWTRRIVPGILYAQSLIYSKEALGLAHRSQSCSESIAVVLLLRPLRRKSRLRQNLLYALRLAVSKNLSALTKLCTSLPLSR